MKAVDFEFVAQFVRDRAAIVLEPGKEYLVESRLSPLAKDQGYADLDALIAALRRQTYGELGDLIVEAMTTNETSFFRDVHPFAALREHVLPELLVKNASARSLKIWCAAASSGQEPYTIAMVLRDVVPKDPPWRIDFVATDICRKMLDRAKSGVFSQQEVNRGLPAAELVRSFRREGASWKVNEELQHLVRFELLNLIRPWSIGTGYDVVFMRNVLIYFDVATKKQILNRVRSAMSPGGYLFLGAAESTFAIDDGFQRKQLGKANVYTVG